TRRIGPGSRRAGWRRRSTACSQQIGPAVEIQEIDKREHQEHAGVSVPGAEELGLEIVELPTSIADKAEQSPPAVLDGHQRENRRQSDRPLSVPCAPPSEPLSACRWEVYAMTDEKRGAQFLPGTGAGHVGRARR